MFVRKTATRIKKGTVQRKNRHAKTPNYWNKRQTEIQIDIENPGKGYKHFLKKRDIKQFLEILPYRDIIDIELDAVILGKYNLSGCDGYYWNGIICICAWEKEMTRSMGLKYFEFHKEMFDKLGLKYSVKEDDVICYFTENQIKAFQLLRVMTHEIGHHIDRIKTKSKKRCPNGEKFANYVELDLEAKLWDKYFEYFSF